MPYRLVLEDTVGGHAIYLFNLESHGQNGWAWLRLVRIEDYTPGSPLKITEYDPVIHDGGSHYMSYLWRARRRVVNGQHRYYLVGAFGDPISRMMLEYII